MAVLLLLCVCGTCKTRTDSLLLGTQGAIAQSAITPYNHLGKGEIPMTELEYQAVLDRYANFIRYFSHINGYYNADIENHIKTKLIESQMKFRFDR